VSADWLLALFDIAAIVVVAWLGGICAQRLRQPRDPDHDLQALSEQHINQREVGPLQAVALGPSEAVALRRGGPARNSGLLR